MSWEAERQPVTGDHDPVGRLEETHGQTDLGRMAVRVYRGALEEAGGDHDLARQATVAYWVGVMRSQSDTEGDS